MAPVGLHPASTTQGAPEIVASGNLLADLELLPAAISTSGRGLAWFIRPADLAYLAATLGAAAADVPRTLLDLGSEERHGMVGPSQQSRARRIR